MKLVTANKEELGVIKMKQSELLKLLEEFAGTDIDCAEIKNFRQKSAQVCAASFNQAIRRYKMSGIRAVQRKNKVYLVKMTKF